MHTSSIKWKQCRWNHCLGPPVVTEYSLPSSQSPRAHNPHIPLQISLVQFRSYCRLMMTSHKVWGFHGSFRPPFKRCMKPRLCQHNWVNCWWKVLIEWTANSNNCCTVQCSGQRVVPSMTTQGKKANSQNTAGRHTQLCLVVQQVTSVHYWCLHGAACLATVQAVCGAASTQHSCVLLSSIAFRTLLLCLAV